MSLGEILIVGSFVCLLIARSVINSKIYNRLHGTSQEMIYSSINTSDEEIDKSSESILFAIYCSLIIVWFKFRREDLTLVIANYVLSALSILLIIVFFRY
tara:strand:+ start:17098 stop:17397 length:300 start_codon:yes stop_codon:yes gene_type:complete